MLRTLKLGAVVLAVLVPALSFGQNYVGTDKCKTCHNAKDKGEMHTKWKTSKHAKAMETLAELYKEYAVDGTRTVGIAHADCPDGALRLQAKLRDAGQTGEILSVCYEPVTGGHVGPGTVALFFFGEVWR